MTAPWTPAQREAVALLAELVAELRDAADHDCADDRACTRCRCIEALSLARAAGLPGTEGT